MPFEGCSGNTVTDSKTNGNGASGGIYFYNGSQDNRVIDSKANDNKGPGIFFALINGSSSGTDTLLSGDTANGNGAQGISVGCPSNLFGNTAQGNAGGDIVTSGTGCARLGNNPAP